MADITIYHNPKCSKSRQTLALLRERGVEPHIVMYLDTPLDIETLRNIARLLHVTPGNLARQGEALFTELGLAEQRADDDAMLQALHEHPILLQRPIVVNGAKAAIGRPPENVLDIL